MLAAMRTSRLSVTTCIFIAASISLLLVMFMFFSESLRAPIDYVHEKAQDYWDKASDSERPTEIYNCEDPYRRPGYLYMPADLNKTGEYKTTRWIPYTDELLDAETPEYAEYPFHGEVVFNATEVEPEFVNLASSPRQWMHPAVAESKRRRDLMKGKKPSMEDWATMQDDRSFGWLWGKRVLLFSDSVDRFMIQFFCEEFGHRMTQPQPHTTATCVIPEFNLTLIHWHFAGSFPYRPEWWWMQDMQDIAFEDRWKNMWLPMTNETIRGRNGKPDLILWQNGLWDQRALWESGEHHYEATEYPLGTRTRQMVWQEVRFVAARLRKFVGVLEEQFPGVPTMFRGLTIHRESSSNDATIYDLDRLSRAIAEKAGHEVFEWGRIITSLAMLYKDQTHPGKGPASWLWGNMLLEYLARIGGEGDGDESRQPYFDGWDSCHEHLVHWGGR
ncbi:hypothetical protein ACJ41O_007152 [Fusarium nematophilum]